MAAVTMKKTTKKNAAKKYTEKKLTPVRKIELFLSALEDVISKEMETSPNRFHEIVLNDSGYAFNFAVHIVEKMKEAKVLVINQTLVEVAIKLGIPVEVNALYDYLEFPRPIAKPKSKPPELERNSFRGC